MARRISFFDFNRALSTGGMPVERLADYVKFDDDSPIPSLIFKSDALLDAPPEHYDIDDEIHRFLRVKKGEEGNVGGDKTVVADGDSWFDLPEFLGRRAIADWIQTNPDYHMVNVAQWGRTLERILQRRDHEAALVIARPEYFMFTAGGNDLQQTLADGHLLHAYDPQRPADDYLTATGRTLIQQIEDGHRDIFARVYGRYPAIQIRCHGYDYPRPQLNTAKYIGRYMRRAGFPPDVMSPVINPIIDLLNDAIARAAATCPNARYLNCRHATDRYTWPDDMHPSNDGFDALAKSFEQAMP